MNKGKIVIISGSLKGLLALTDALAIREEDLLEKCSKKVNYIYLKEDLLKMLNAYLEGKDLMNTCTDIHCEFCAFNNVEEMFGLFKVNHPIVSMKITRMLCDALTQITDKRWFVSTFAAQQLLLKLLREIYKN